MRDYNSILQKRIYNLPMNDRVFDTLINWLKENGYFTVFLEFYMEPEENIISMLRDNLVAPNVTLGVAYESFMTTAHQLSSALLCNEYNTQSEVESDGKSKAVNIGKGCIK